MRVFKSGGLDPQARAVASEAFSRSWQFIERDPVLAGHEREMLQAELALRIQEIMISSGSERDPLRIANRAIGRMREDMRARGSQEAWIKLAS
jgi:predicted nucleotide-binding protein (sugar kinase/HSP70/actin superfamily)